MHQPCARKSASLLRVLFSRIFSMTSGTRFARNSPNHRHRRRSSRLVFCSLTDASPVCFTHTFSYLQHERAFHMHFVEDRSGGFIGRSAILGELLRFVHDEQRDPLPLVVLGPPASHTHARVGCAPTRSLPPLSCHRAVAKPP